MSHDTITTEDTRHSRPTVRLHWIVALLLAAAIPLGFAVEGRTGLVLGVHVALGGAVVLLSLARVMRRMTATPRPRPVGGAFERGLARAVQIGLSFLPLAIGASGIAILASTGADTLLSPDEALAETPARAAHGVMARLLILLASLHVAGALRHALIRRDGVIRRIAWR